MRSISTWLNEYGESHQNATNKLIHWICVPLIMFSIVGLIGQIPFPFHAPAWLNWATISILFVLLFYLRLSFPIFLGFVLIAYLLLWGNYVLDQRTEHTALILVVVFVLAWIGQFIGHKIEGKKPSFFKDLQFLLIGPAWLLSFIYRSLGIKY